MYECTIKQQFAKQPHFLVCNLVSQDIHVCIPFAIPLGSVEMPWILETVVPPGCILVCFAEWYILFLVVLNVFLGSQKRYERFLFSLM